MRIRYIWRSEEWREAVLLASQPSRRATKPLSTYVMIGIMGLGATGEIANAIRSSSQIQVAGSLAPTILLGAMLTGVVFVARRSAIRNRRMRDMPGMPTEEQALVLCEEGWRSAAVADEAAVPMRPWQALSEQRRGRRTLIVTGPGGRFAAVPLRALSVAEGGHVHRLLKRKLRPTLERYPERRFAA